MYVYMCVKRIKLLFCFHIKELDILIPTILLSYEVVGFWRCLNSIFQLTTIREISKKASDVIGLLS